MLSLVSFLLFLTTLSSTSSVVPAELAPISPSIITLRAAVLHSPPLAIVEDSQEDGGEVRFSGYQIDLLKRLSIFAKQEDNITLNFELYKNPRNDQYNALLDLVANDCNSTTTTTASTQPKNTLEDCSRYDFILGDYYMKPDRHMRIDYTPAWIYTGISVMKFTEKTTLDLTTLSEAEAVQAPVCVLAGSATPDLVLPWFPRLNFYNCGPSRTDCVDSLKEGRCILYAEDELMLRYMTLGDPTLEVTREKLNTQYIAWPLSEKLPRLHSKLLKKYLYKAITNATLDELYSIYFQRELCPIGTAGINCELPCDPNHGQADAQGTCTCLSTKWTGDDCSIEVLEDLNLIPQPLKVICYGMVGMNFLVVAICAIWLFLRRKTPQVRISQPIFLTLVLVGCLISTSTIIALVQENDGYDQVPACMAIPWLYSVGFSITFGTLFAKIRRVYVLFSSAAEMRRTTVSARSTFVVIGAVLAIDVCILLSWSIVDPLEWRREIVLEDQFGEPLASMGHCISDYWYIFGSCLGVLHFALLVVACYMCYVSRNIPTSFSEGKYLSIAMVSNLQIFIVGVPVLVIVGADPGTSTFVRSAIIWMNDLAVVVLIFGNLMYSAHLGSSAITRNNPPVSATAMISSAVREYSVRDSSAGRQYFGSGQSLADSTKSGGSSWWGQGSSKMKDAVRIFNAARRLDGRNPFRRHSQTMRMITLDLMKEEIRACLEESSHAGSRGHHHMDSPPITDMTRKETKSVPEEACVGGRRSSSIHFGLPNPSNIIKGNIDDLEESSIDTIELELNPSETAGLRRQNSTGSIFLPSETGHLSAALDGEVLSPGRLKRIKSTGSVLLPSEIDLSLVMCSSVHDSEMHVDELFKLEGVAGNDILALQPDNHSEMEINPLIC